MSTKKEQASADEAEMLDAGKPVRLIRPGVLHPPDRLAFPPAWVGHIPFAFWLIDVLRPSTFVELGSHSGNSYSAFCQAIQRLGITTAAFAIDTWKGDEHAGHYGEEVFADFAQYHDSRFAGFSRLVRSTFDAAVNYFGDSSIDLLHIDGLHTYDAVRHDFETWLPKLSARGVVLFHDTNVRENDFGVWKYWQELSAAYPHFQFDHCNGLGVLGVGSKLPRELKELLSLSPQSSGGDYALVREFFSTLGVIHQQTYAARSFEAERERLEQSLTERLRQLETNLAQREVDVAQRDAAIKEVNARKDTVIGELTARLKQVEADGTKRLEQSLTERLRQLESNLTQKETDVAQRDAAIKEVDARKDTVISELTARLQQVEADGTKKDALVNALAARVAKLNKANVNALSHYELSGRSRGRKLFRDLAALLSLHQKPPVEQAVPEGVSQADLEAIRYSVFFDAQFYLNANPDVAASGGNPALHYLQHGGFEGRDPGPLFSTRRYLECNPDVAKARHNALAHYELYGRNEGRTPFATASFSSSHQELLAEQDEPHGVSHFALEVIRNSSFFDPEFYLETNPEVKAAGLDPALHYLQSGASRGLNPGPSFSTKDYLHQNPDVAKANANALLHYELYGRSEGRSVPNYDPVAAPDAAVRQEFTPLFRGEVPKRKLAKLICFYLPQFHAIPENDAWWGKDFTEWTNVRAGQPKFKGHYQPRIPGELGYYNLLNPEVQRRQVELAKLYGIGGFSFYFYWFAGKTLLERPIENYLKNHSLDLPFCLCWANENWTRRWDGLDSEVLIAQRHSPMDDIAFIEHIARYFHDPRYIRIDGKPLLVVYRPALLPSPRNTAQRWRGWCRDNGVGEVYLAYTQSFEKTHPTQYGFDAAIEFPPNISGAPIITDDFVQTPGSEAIIFDWRYLTHRQGSYQHPKYKLFRGVCPSWDNTARRKSGGGAVFVNSTPALYRQWLREAIRDTQERFKALNERLVFVNAWNEWGEGTYLEPDARNGYAYLQASRDAVYAPEDRGGNDVLLFVTHDCHPHGAQFLSLEIVRQLKLDGFELAIIALDGGKLYDDFAQVGRIINAKKVDAAQLQGFIAELRADGARYAITSTVVSGMIVPQLKELGFRVLSLVHELPGIIKDLGQERNAAAIARFADKVVFPAEMVYRRFSEILPVSTDRVVLRHQGLLRQNPYKNRNANAYRVIAEKHHLPPDTQIVLSVAFGDSRKAPDLIADIAAKVLADRPNSVFIWVGDIHPELQQKVTQQLKECGVQQKVLFIGFDREPFAYYAAASVYALTSREDPFPNVVLESAEVGIPVVAFEGATGAGDFILEHGGRLARYLDTGDFARQICVLLAEPARKAAAPVPALQRYTLDLLNALSGFPRVSVIVPSYNYAQHITRRLDSIFHQNFPFYEVIVLDDASTDNSAEVVRSYLRRTGNEGRLIINENNSGSVFHQWRKGLASCSGDLVWFAEADDVAEFNFLRELVSAFADPEVVLAFSQSKQIDDNDKVLAENYLDYTNDVSNRWRESYVCDGIDEISESLTIKNTIPNVSAVLFRRQALEKAIADVGEDLFAYEVAGDWLVYLHVLLQGKLYFNNKALNLHRRHTNSVTKALDVARHFREVCQLQEIARSMSAPSDDVLAKAKNYAAQLREYFGISEGVEDGR